MDTNAGEFVGEERAESWMQRIEIGEVVKIKGEELEVVMIGRHEITLKLLGQRDRDRRAMQSIVEEQLGNYADLADAESKRQLKNVLKRQK